MDYRKVICIKDCKLYPLKVGDICYIDDEIIFEKCHMMMTQMGEETIFLFPICEYFVNFSEFRDKRIEEILG